MATAWLKFVLACLVFANFVMSEGENTDIKPLRHVKPSGHVVALHLQGRSYPKDTMIKDWTTEDSLSHLKGGMKYEDGKLIVPKAGRYYIYAQLYFKTNGRVQIRVNDALVSLIIVTGLIASPVIREGEPASANGIGVFELKAGDTISLWVDPYRAPLDGSVQLYMAGHHDYLGAFSIKV